VKENVPLEDDEKEENWVLASRIEYLHFTGSRFLLPSWLKTARLIDDDTGDKFSQTLLYGAGHGLASLNQRSHLWIQDALDKARLGVGDRVGFFT